MGEKDAVWPVIYEEAIQAGGVYGLTHVYESLIEPLAQCGKQGQRYAPPDHSRGPQHAPPVPRQPCHTLSYALGDGPGDLSAPEVCRARLVHQLGATDEEEWDASSPLRNRLCVRRLQRPLNQVGEQILSLAHG